MDDELEDRILYQAYLSHMKLISRFAVGIPTAGINGPLSQLWRAARGNLLRPELLLIGAALVAMVVYVRVVSPWSQAVLQKLQYTLEHTTTKVSKWPFLANGSSSKKADWELRKDYVAAYALQGHRAHMEDRFVVNSDIGDTGVSLFAVFDGHGGQLAANYARDHLVPSIVRRIAELKGLAAGQAPRAASKAAAAAAAATATATATAAAAAGDVGDVDDDEEEASSSSDGEGADCPGAAKAAEPAARKRRRQMASARRKRKTTWSRRTATSLTDDCTNVGITDPELLSKIDSLSKTITREVRANVKLSSSSAEERKKLSKVDVSSYLNGNEINYSKLLTDQILAADGLLVEAAKKTMDVAGTTALIAIIEGNKLTVANVGDSRGVMCDGKGNAIPLSFDHKPQQQRERNRINKAGGVVTFNGVWRVAGILATSRALGDYPLKDRKLVIAEPDILTFDLDDHNPMFLVLASDGLWDTFSNEEAVAFIKERMNEPHFGAKSITLQSYYRGSLDNITVLVINLKNRKQNAKTTTDQL